MRNGETQALLDVQHSQWRWTSSFIQPTSCCHTSSNRRSRTAWRRHRYGEMGGKQRGLRPDSEKSCSHSSSLVKTDKSKSLLQIQSINWQQIKWWDQIHQMRSFLRCISHTSYSQVSAIESQVLLHQTLYFNHRRLLLTGAAGGSRSPVHFCWAQLYQLRSPALHVQPSPQHTGTHSWGLWYLHEV